MPLLEVDRLYARYDHAPVLHGVSFGMDAGEIVSIFGRNGAGKTTTLRTIMGWLRPSQGQIVFAGEVLTARLSGITRSIFISGVRWEARSRSDWDWRWHNRNAASWSLRATAKC